MDDLIAKIEVALDPTARQAALQASYDFAFEEASVLWIHNFKQITGTRDTLKGWEYNFMYGWNYAPFEQMSMG
jgi:ABC-type transport system substrate-binding protein